MRTAFAIFLLAAAVDEKPVTKVINLLKDMQGQLIAEKKEDEKLYEKMACWCKNNGEGKGAAVEIATKRIADLEHSIKALASKASGLETALEKLASESEADKEALAEATKLRAKEQGEFEQNEKDLIVSIEGLKNALTVLAKAHSFLQVPAGDSFLSVKRTVSRLLNKGDDVLAQILGAGERHALGAFVQDDSAAPASGEILGILQQMQENFEGNLKDMQNTEATAKADFKEMEAAKKAELAAAEAQTKEKTALLSKTTEEHAQAKEDFEDTTAAMTADQTFLADLKKRCAASDEEWIERSKTRAAEIQAVTETIGILTDDDAHDTFDRTLGFLQLPRFDYAQLSPRGAALVQEAYAAKAGVQSRVKLDAFKRVTASIDEMITDLKKEMKDEVDHKDYCNKAIQKNEAEAYETENEIKDLGTKIADLESAVDSAAADLKALKAEINDLQVELMRASMNRVEENQAFQAVVADQRATQVVLAKARDRMADFYGNKAALVQQEPGAAAPPPPPAQKEYKANAGAGGVMTMLENILTDAKELEAEAIKGEMDAQGAYEDFVHNTNASVEEAQRAVAAKTEERARFESEKVQAEADKEDATGRQEALAKDLINLHSSCDFVLDNFKVRQEARGGEIESLQGALAALKTA